MECSLLISNELTSIIFDTDDDHAAIPNYRPTRPHVKEQRQRETKLLLDIYLKRHPKIQIPSENDKEARLVRAFCFSKVPQATRTIVGKSGPIGSGPPLDTESVGLWPYTEFQPYNHYKKPFCRALDMTDSPLQRGVSVCPTFMHPEKFF